MPFCYQSFDSQVAWTNPFSDPFSTIFRTKAYHLSDIFTSVVKNPALWNVGLHRFFVTTPHYLFYKLSFSTCTGLPADWNVGLVNFMVFMAVNCTAQSHNDWFTIFIFTCIAHFVVLFNASEFPVSKGASHPDDFIEFVLGQVTHIKLGFNSVLTKERSEFRIG